MHHLISTAVIAPIISVIVTFFSMLFILQKRYADLESKICAKMEKMALKNREALEHFFDFKYARVPTVSEIKFRVDQLSKKIEDLSKKD